MTEAEQAAADTAFRAETLRKMDAEIAKLIGETRRIDPEVARLIAETAKLNAEAAKIQRERFWIPFTIFAGVLVAAATAAVTIAMRLIPIPS